jgi:hypothetical protein
MLNSAKNALLATVVFGIAGLGLVSTIIFALVVYDTLYRISPWYGVLLAILTDFIGLFATLFCIYEILRRAK